MRSNKSSNYTEMANNTEITSTKCFPPSIKSCLYNISDIPRFVPFTENARLKNGDLLLMPVTSHFASITFTYQIAITLTKLDTKPYLQKKKKKKKKTCATTTFWRRNLEYQQNSLNEELLHHQSQAAKQKTLLCIRREWT